MNLPKQRGRAQKDFKQWDGVIPSMLYRSIAPAVVHERGTQSGYMWDQGLGLEMIVVVSLRRDDNDLWQRSGDREEVTHFQRGACMLAIVWMWKTRGEMVKVNPTMHLRCPGAWWYHLVKEGRGS